MASSIVPAPHHEQHTNVDVLFLFIPMWVSTPPSRVLILSWSFSTVLIVYFCRLVQNQVISFNTVSPTEYSPPLFLLYLSLLDLFYKLILGYQFAVPNLFASSEVVLCVQNVQLLQELLHLQHLHSARFPFPPHILGREQRKSLSEWTSWQVHNRCWEMSPMRSLISWPWCFVRHAFLGGNHPNCPGLIRQSPTFTSLSKRTSFERPRRHSDFTMRERPTLRLDFTITLFFLRDTFHFRLCCLCCLWCLCADHGYFFLFFTFVACLQYLVFLRQKRWYNVIWLFWIVILVRNGVWMELRKFDGALFLFWIVKSILKVNYPIFRSFLLCGCGKRKREKGIYVDARWFRHAPAFLDTQKGIICSTRATWASSFLPEWKINGANTTPANGKKNLRNQIGIRDIRNARLDPLLG